MRIHVERIIGFLKRKYTFFQGTLFISLISHKDGSSDSTIDKIILNIFDLIPNLTMQQIGYPIVTVSCLHDCLIVLAGGTEMIWSRDLSPSILVADHVILTF